MDILALQLDISWENKAQNFSNVHRLLAQAAPGSGSLVALPEMFATGFSMNTAAIAEPYGGDTEVFLASMAREFGVYILGGAAMRGRDGLVRNKALLFSPTGELAGFYAKMRPFTPGGESEHYTAGEKPTVFPLPACHLAPLICYDLRFPELFRASAATHRLELFVVIANWPQKRVLHWTRLLQARAIENQAYVVGVNRVGQDPFYTYSGHSAVIDFNGDIIADAGEAEGFVCATLDFATLKKYRDGLPFLKDMR
ncbi:MAG: nitrilase-related carbon-nitrogen hydrolase [Limisphaerales bacterium]